MKERAPHLGSPFYLDLVGVIEFQTKPPQRHLSTEGVFHWMAK